MTFDVLIIGAGLSGLAAGIRLAHFGKRVVIVEAHSVCGGLNSYYRRGPRMLDVGLHAMTNFVGRGTRGAPLTKLLRQLRIPHAALGLIEQSGSVIQSPSCSLRFTNDFEVLRGDVRENFPGQIDSFDRLTEIIDGHDEATLDPPVMSARKVVVEVITDPQLAEMLFVPLMYYGNPAERDMDFAQFAVMWKALYRSGLARPEAGMKHVVDLLVERYSGAGGELRLRTSVEELVVDDGRVVGVRLAGGEEIAADQVLSSAGLVETMRLCSDREASWLGEKIGRLSFVELIATLDVEPRSLGIDKTIVFFDDEGPLQYRRPDGLVGLSSGVICC
ncbi:MAG: FAD-dependent oxidoreductase, partial [Myxococcota bacterium]|nr:FAD-dependent oxidoreductase [Myxococcota bacterium]